MQKAGMVKGLGCLVAVFLPFWILLTLIESRTAWDAIGLLALIAFAVVLIVKSR
jgi:hypothetical protein